MDGGGRTVGRSVGWHPSPFLLDVVFVAGGGDRSDDDDDDDGGDSDP